MAERIAGMALMPRESRNGIYYDVEELKKFDGITVPLRVEHGGPESDIGSVTFQFDEVKGQVKYEATVTDKKWQEILDNEMYQVSIGAKILEQRQLCDEMKKKCLNSPVLGEILELSVVRTPGIPESTMTVIEHNVDTLVIMEDQIQYSIPQPENTSNIPTEQNQVMTNDTSEKNVNEKVKVTIETDGEVEVGKAETKAEVAPEVKAPEVKTEKVDVVAKIEESNANTLKSVIETVSKMWQPKSEVAESTSPQGYVEEAFTDETARAFLNKVFENGYGRLIIDKEGWIEAHTVDKGVTGAGSVQEAVSTSGTIPGVKQRSNIAIQLGAKTAISIRQYGQFEALPVGVNTARFYRISVPDAGAITESPTTDITAATHTLTSISVNCAIRGWRQVVEKAELEDYPASFLNAVRETARLESIRDEHKLIVQDLAFTDHDFGGVTTAPYHIGGSDGVATTTTTEEDADGEFDEDGLTFAKRYLTELGQDTSPGNLVAFLSPRAFEALSTASTLSEYTQIGNPSVTKLGQMERLYGIDIIVTNELYSANNATRNLVCVKGASWGLASQRSMELELQKTIAGQYWDLVWTHRIGVDIIDPNTYVIVSTVKA